MNWAPPDWIREASHKSMDQDMMSNHYAHPRGRPRLIKALSEHYSPSFENLVAEGRKLQTDEIVVTAGANCGESRECRPGAEPSRLHTTAHTRSRGFLADTDTTA